ncbi:hypothetical protein E2C01_062585 [Portunus trituberculatus]|uniref:Uncharacterized protein n=1 Tax=Portunus trituberculatus TaxID=210409 RepID=A0A5B7HFQ0_PORTR|nr:hypothetical protein [Portunus trituberculatus]
MSDSCLATVAGVHGTAFKQSPPQPGATLLHHKVALELNTAFFPGGPDVWPPHPLAYTAELPGSAAAAAASLQHHHPALFPALHAQVPVRSYL